MPHNSAADKARNRHLALAVAASTLLTGAMTLPWTAGPAVSQDVVVLDIDVKEVAKGYRASQLTGAEVTNGGGETIGSIDDLIVDQEKVLFAIIEVGGFLGIGGFLVAVPFNSLEIGEDGAKIVLVQGSKDELGQLPEFKYKEE